MRICARGSPRKLKRGASSKSCRRSCSSAPSSSKTRTNISSAKSKSAARWKLALRESEERYALAARGANDGLWDWNLVAGEVYLSERWREMVGVVDRSLSPSPEEWFSRVHLSDLPQLKVDIAAQAAGSRSHFHSEHRLRHSEGFFIWVLCRGIVVRDGEGRALRIAGSMTDITARKDLEERLRREAQFDSLTTLPNRSYATDLLRRAIARAKRNKEQQFGVLFLDCDRFKVVNDSLGHHAGDSLLRLVAGRLNGCVRPGDVVARLGGDEFVVILEGVKDEAEAISVAERIQHSLAQPFYLDGRELFMSVSVGIAMSQPGRRAPGGLSARRGSRDVPRETARPRAARGVPRGYARGCGAADVARK